MSHFDLLSTGREPPGGSDRIIQWFGKTIANRYVRLNRDRVFLQKARCFMKRNATERHLWSIAVFMSLSLLSPTCSEIQEASRESAAEQIALWPEIEPFRSEHLRVSDLHEIYYELCGNPEGVPVFYLHGGPGGSISPYARRFYDPQKYLIVLHDQRGTGKSRPFGEIRENTTWDLVEDIEKLRVHLEVNDILLFGGSWGSTLALAYAETYPEHVAGMVLRGVFTATKEEIDYFYHGGVSAFFPAEYDALLSALPDPDRRPLPEYLYDLIINGNEEEKKRYSDAWARYEIKISGLNVPDPVVENILKEHDFYSFGLLENYYMSNLCFFEKDQIYREIDRIARIPTVIVNGRYDVICPPRTAYRLHRLLKNSDLVIAEGAGHWMGEDPVEKALLQAFRKFESRSE